MEEELKSKKPSGLPFRKLCALLSLLLAVIALAAADWRLETHGLPAFAVNYLKRHLAAQGVSLTLESLKCGVLNGIILEDARIDIGRKYEGPAFKAERIRAAFSPFRIFDGNYLPLSFAIERGSFSVPVFPESGEEGVSDCLQISDFNGSISVSNGKVIVERANGSFQNFEFKMSGTVENFLTAAGAKGGAVLHEKLAVQPPPAPRQASPKPAPAPKEAKPSPKPVAAAYASSFASKVPMQFRRRLMRAIDRIKAEKFDGPPRCSLNFSLDLADYRRSSIKADISIPSFEYGHLKIGSLKQELTLKDGLLEIRNVRVDLGGGEFIEAGGLCDTVSNSVSGEISGLCAASKLLLFLDEASRRRVNAKFRFGDELIAFKGSLQSFSLSTGRYKGAVEFNVPFVSFNGVPFRKLAGSASIDDALISGRLSGAEVDGDGEIEGDFRFSSESFDCRIEGSANFETAKRFLSPSARSFVDDNVRVLSDDKLVSFSGSLKSPDPRRGLFSGSFDILVPQVCFRDLEIKMLSSHLDFSSDSLSLSDVHATLDDGTRLSGEMRCKPSAKLISASLICLGSPDRTLSLLGPEQRSFLKSVIKDIEWPLAGNLIESSIDLHYKYGKSPFCYMTGSLVMTDFEYRGIKFKYGATRFILDSDRLLILPGALLETKEGQAVISICYKGGGAATQVRPIRLDGSDSDASPPPDGRLDFELESSISGDDIIRCFYPKWRSEFIDFPKSVQAFAKGSIDYKDPDASAFSAKIQNGSCVWKGVSVTNIDASLLYKDRRLSFKGAEADLCSGKLKADYSFSFRSLSGDIALNIQNAELLPLLKQIGWGEMVGAGKPGKLSTEMASKLAYDAEGHLLLDGKGKLNVSGADLWSIPLFGEFLKFLGKAWSLQSLGSITTIDSEFVLDKDRFQTESIKSDGGFVALSGDGRYLWDSDEFDFRFRAELLKGALPFETLSRLLAPVSWILEKRLRGKGSSYKWD